MSLDAFSGEARGMQAIGQGVGQLATPLNTFAQAFSRAQTAADNAKIKIELEDWKTRLIDKTNQLPPDQRDKAWQEAVPELEKTLNGMDISPAARDKRDPEMIKFLGETRIAIQHGARLQKIADQQDVISTAAQKAMDNGNFEEAVAQIQTGVNSYIFSKPQGDKIIQKIQDNQKRQGWQQAINSDPFAALETLQQDTKNGTSDTFKGANPVELARLTETARSEVNRQRVDATKNIENLQDAGIITNDDQIKETGGKAIDDTTFKALQNRLKNVAPNFEAFADIQTQIAQLVPRDPKDPRYNEFMEKAQELRNRVNSEVGSAYRSPFIQELSGKLQRSVSGTPVKPEDGVVASAKTYINHTLLEGNVFGAFKKVRDEKTGAVNKAEQANFIAAWEKKEQFLDLFNTAVKNGKITDHASATAWIKDNLSQDQMRAMVLIPKEQSIWDKAWNVPGDIKSWWENSDAGNFFDDQPAAIKPPSPDDLTKQGKSILNSGRPRTSPTPLPQGAIPAPKGSKITNYWPTEVKGKDGMIGNHGNKLTDGDFAASPDVLASLKENGAKPGDPVQIHLSDGSTVMARFNDSTATDDQQKSKGKAPLRGRFDVWTATKGHPKDGVAVLGYSLPNRQS
jgi:hypothetical protein